MHNALVLGNIGKYRKNNTSLKLDSLGYISVQKVSVYLQPLLRNAPESYRIRWNNAW